jgi:hypothetical protein
MTIFQPQQSNRGRRVGHNADATALQIHVTNCVRNSRRYFHEARKIVCNNFQSAVQAYAAECQFYTSHAEPLSWLRFLRLANRSLKLAQSPARWARDVRETSGETTREISRTRPCNLSAMAGQRHRQSRWTNREMIRKTTCLAQDLAAQQSRNNQGNISQDDSSKSRRQFQP